MQDLLNTITVAQLDDLLRNMDLLQHGYKLNFVVDTYDIVEFCFPFGIKHKHVKGPDEIGDEQLAYDFLFSGANNFEVCILAQYRTELIHVRNRIVRQSEEIINQKNDFTERFILPIVRESDDGRKKKMIRELENTLSFLVSYAMIVPQSVKRFFDLLKGRLSIEGGGPFEKFEELFPEDLESVSNDVRMLLAEWVNYNKAILKKANTDMERMSILDSVRRDITVVLRVIHANDLLARRGEKQIFLYHSSTPDRSASIFELDSVKKLLTKYQNQAHKILWTKQQSFLMALLINWERINVDKEGQLSEVKHRLLKIKEIKENYLAFLESNSEVATEGGLSFMDYTKLTEDIFLQGRNNFGNNSLLEKIANYSLFNDAISKQIESLRAGSTEFEPIARIYENCLIQAHQSSTAVLTSLTLENAQLFSSLQTNISEVIARLLEDKTISVAKGSDFIRGTFHHLPLLLYYSRQDRLPAPAKQILEPLVEFCMLSQKEQDLNIGTFLIILRGYSEFNGHRANDTPTLTVISLLLSLLVSSTATSDDSYSRERYLLTRSKELLDIFNSYPDVATGVLDHRPELIYLNCWLYRRCGEFDKALEMAEEGYKAYPLDPRFVHGKALASYSKEFINKELSNEASILKIVECSHLAIDLYTRSPAKYFDYACAALNNQLCHLYSSLYMIAPRSPYLESARKHLRLLEGFCRNKGVHFEDYPEFLHTRASMLLSEVIGGNMANKVSFALETLSAAEEDMAAAYRLEKSSSVYLQTLADIKSQYSKYRSIFLNGVK